jgi:hypothetical protein
MFVKKYLYRQAYEHTQYILIQTLKCIPQQTQTEPVSQQIDLTFKDETVLFKIKLHLEKN